MVCHRPVPILLLWFAGMVAADAGEQMPPRLCPENAPEGVRLPSRRGCGSERALDRSARDQGFRDIDGVKLRVGGRITAEYGVSR